MDSRINPIVVLGSWSCGSTAVAGYLERLGAYSPRPHQPTNDPRTPDSHEPKALRDALVDRIDELSLQWRDTEAGPLRDWLGAWLEQETARAAQAGHTHLVLKHPLLAFYLADLHALCRPRFVVVTRELVHIEASRRRRRWHRVYGRDGARPLYSAIFNTLLEHTVSALVCHYAPFRTDAELRAGLRDWAGLAPQAASLEAAERWVG